MREWALPVALGLGASAAIMTGVLLLSGEGPDMECPGDWYDPEAPKKIRAIAKPVERLLRLDGLGDFLVAIAWIESRGNEDAAFSSSSNAARGWFGMRPKTARVAELGLEPDDILDPRTAVALAVWNMHRCFNWLDEGQVMTWESIRRCWKYPHLTDNEDDTSVVPNLEKGLACAGVPAKFMDRRLSRRYRWPGVEAVFEAVGRPL